MEARKNFYLEPKNFFINTLLSILLISGFWLLCWLICIGLQKGGCPLPVMNADKFSDLGFFALSNFNFITFVSILCFQTVEGKLAPGFYIQTMKRPWIHFGLYVLVSSFAVCYAILSGLKNYLSPEILSQLFIAVVASVIFAIIFHRHQALLYLNHPLTVYKHLTEVNQKNGYENLWLDLYECALKAIHDHRINDALEFSKLLSIIYARTIEPERVYSHQKDLHSLYRSAKEQHPVCSYLEKQWPFLCLHIETNDISR